VGTGNTLPGRKKKVSKETQKGKREGERGKGERRTRAWGEPYGWGKGFRPKRGLLREGEKSGGEKREGIGHAETARGNKKTKFEGKNPQTKIVPEMVPPKTWKIQGRKKSDDGEKNPVKWSRW